MSFLDTIKSALMALNTHKLRSFLAAIGIIIGIMSVISIVALGEGSRIQVENEFRSLGTNMIEVNINDIPNKMLDMTLLDKIAEKDIIQYVAPMEVQYTTARSDLRTIDSTVKATTYDFAIMNEFKILKGRFFTDFENLNNSKVAVIGTRAALNIFGNTNCINQTFKIKSNIFTIIGILDIQGSSWGEDLDAIIYIPFNTGQRTFNIKGINKFYVKAINEDSVNTAEWIIKSYLRNWIDPYGYSTSTNNLQDTEDNVNGKISSLDRFFDIYSDTVTIKAMSDSMRTITALISGIGAISLLVGCIGIINIMLVSMYERTREIGIRKALGAKNSSILAQLLFEAMILTLLGGIIGSILGISGAFLAGYFLNITPKITIIVILLAIILSITSGLISGIYPAIRASRMEPVAALRYE